VQRAMSFFRVELSELVVLHDELDLPFGALRLKRGGGAAGHNGLRSIMQHCGGPEFARLRVGIGRPVHGPAEKHVLSDFSVDEKLQLDDVLKRGTDAVDEVVRRGLDAAMNAVNVREKGARASS
jgi:peptidyl-tRNA hydrolase, PTH1 family